MNLTIKNIPETIYKSLKQEAALRGRSLNSEAILALAAKSEELERRRAMRTTRKDLEKFVASLPRMSSSVPLIREDRDRR
jgi:plasmid stability protein